MSKGKKVLEGLGYEEREAIITKSSGRYDKVGGSEEIVMVNECYDGEVSYIRIGDGVVIKGHEREAGVINKDELYGIYEICKEQGWYNDEEVKRRYSRFGE